MIVSRAQCLALWALASELPTDTVIEIVGLDNYDALTVVASSPGSPYLPEPRRYKLSRLGSRKLIEEEREQ